MTVPWFEALPDFCWPPICKHCGGQLVRLPDGSTVRTNGWAHVEVNGSPLEEPCRINPTTLGNARGTTFAEPAAAASSQPRKDDE